MKVLSQEVSFSRFLVPGIGLAVVALFAALFTVDDKLYQTVLTVWMLSPFPHPFIDWQYVPAAAECWSRGIDVYVATPCYEFGPTFKNSYSPLLLRFSFLPNDLRSTITFGIGWAVLFWVAQAYLPPPRTRRELEVTVLVAFSSLSAFAIERGNVDLVIFSLAVLGAVLWLGPLPCRLLAYAVFIVAGLLKFYPLILLGLVLRERPRVFLLVTLVAGLVLVTCVLATRDELIAGLHNVPTGSYFTDLFGAVNLPFGLPVLASYVASKIGLGSVPASMLGWVRTPVYVALVLATAVGAALLAFRWGVRAGVAALPARRRVLLLIGALLLSGCFFAGQSIGYRGIFLILLLPGLLELRRILPPLSARCITATLYAVVFVSWVLTLEWLARSYGLTRDYSLQYDGVGLLHWFLHEAAWWWIVTVLLATILSFVADSTMVNWIGSTMSRRQGATVAL